MEEHDKSVKLSPEIYVYATNKNFLNVYDALRISKVKLEIAGYDPDSRRQTGYASAWLDKDDARLLCHLVCNRLFLPVTGGRWEKFGGSTREDGHLESRTMLVEWDEGEGGRFARLPYRITVSNGPGRKTRTGGVSPAGEPTARLAMRVPELDMIKLMLAVGDYIHAYATAHHHRIVADRLHELRDKLAERNMQQEARAAASTRVQEPVPSRLPDRPAAYREEREEEANVRQEALPAPTPLGVRPPLRAMPGGNREPMTMPQRPVRTGTSRAG